MDSLIKFYKPVWTVKAIRYWHGIQLESGLYVYLTNVDDLGYTYGERAYFMITPDGYNYKTELTFYYERL